MNRSFYRYGYSYLLKWQGTSCGALKCAYIARSSSAFIVARSSLRIASRESLTVAPAGAGVAGAYTNSCFGRLGSSMQKLCIEFADDSDIECVGDARSKPVDRNTGGLNGFGWPADAAARAYAS